MYFDSHAHYVDAKFDADRHTLLASMPENGVEYIVNPAEDTATAREAMALAEQYPFFYFAAGFHPHEASEMKPEDRDALRVLLAHPKAVAVGEIGLDYHYDFSPRDVQQRVFREMLALAREMKMPAIVHDRESTADTLSILREFPDVHGVVHCFSGSWETAKQLLDMGWYISFTGSVTFKNARRAVEVAEKMPLERMMIETDAPYMAPEPCRGQRCSSLLLPHIAARIGEIRGIPADEVARATVDTARKFFNI